MFAEERTKASMACRSCRSKRQTEFGADINIHLSASKGMDEPAVLVFPRFVVCLDCGLAEFTLDETELRLLLEGAA